MRPDRRGDLGTERKRKVQDLLPSSPNFHFILPGLDQGRTRHCATGSGNQGPRAGLTPIDRLGDDPYFQPQRTIGCCRIFRHIPILVACSALASRDGQCADPGAGHAEGVVGLENNVVIVE